MKSILELYRIGRGPSSSHTMGPYRAAELFHMENAGCDSVRVELRGSLGLTGRGHQTDRAICDALDPLPCMVEFLTEREKLPHPNTMDFYAYTDGKETAHMRALSPGGGAVRIEGRPDTDTPEVYPERSFAEISGLCKTKNMRLPDYVALREGADIYQYLLTVWQAMRRCVYQGLTASGTLPGGLGVERKAQYLYNQCHIDESESTRENRLVCAYAFAAGEQNAGGGMVVTAPTCGSCGVVPAALMYMQDKHGFTDERVVRALCAAGVVGNIIKTNASISGAECGCQAEVGAACSMAAAALGELFGLGIDQIEYAAEVAMEHHLGLTCDPIGGLVQIPCIERNAVAAMRAINAVSLANFLAGTRRISFDMVVETMYETGRDMSHYYRETSQGGLAKLYAKLSPPQPTADP